jgi:ubiquitin C-terminal hydrolase
MKIKNSFEEENHSIDKVRKTSGKSVDKIIKKSVENSLEHLNYKYYDDTNLKIKNKYNCILKDLDKSIEKEDTTSKDSKENTLNRESFSISSQFSLSILVNKNKSFKNLKIEENISEEIIKKKKCNKIEKQIKFSFFPKKEEEIYDENKKYDFLKKIKPKGLRNLGGCCYMNATLQCFYHIKEFTYYFLDNIKEIKRKNGVLSKGYLDLVEGLSNLDKETYYVPQKFKNSLLEIDDSFRGSEGKDSADLIELILYNLQQELGGDSDFPDMSIDQREERLIYLDLYYKNSKVHSIISELFNFEINSISKCVYCGIPFYNISTEYSILFSLEGVYKFYNNIKKNKGDENSDNNENNDYNDNSDDILLSLDNREKRVSIDQCLTHYALDGALMDNITCKYCKKNSSIFTTRSFITLPKIIIMIMSRGEGEKFECDVDFEEELDLADLYTGLKGIDRENNTKYTLLAGTILYGSGGWGHTVAFAKHFDGKYYIFNDSSTRRTTLDEIKKSKIYLLFYQKIN